ncbi:hypothetical protein LTR86_001882 [Recurvomyces mirabilis]|nr:hypothetical protein LTR86_001882 [Recurvomyces mirabilis]
MFGFKPKKEAREADMDPGLDVMMDLERRTRLKARLPSRESVAKAFETFFKSKYNDQGSKVEDNQARLALQSLKYCLEPEVLNDTPAKTIAHSEAVLTACVCLNKRYPVPITNDHLELARTLHDMMADQGPKQAAAAVRPYIRMLCALGQPTEAREVLLSYEQRHQISPQAKDAEGHPTPSSVDGAQYGVLPASWGQILVAFCAAGAQYEVTTTLEMVRERDLLETTAITRAMLEVSLRFNKIEEIERWWRAHHNVIRGNKASPLSSRGINLKVLYARTVGSALAWCVSNGANDLGRSIVSDLMEENPPKPVWDAIFVWAAGTGKSVDEIGRMIEVMEESNDSSLEAEERRLPDSATINALVAWAISKDDPYTAERFIALGRDRGIEPDAKTFVLQMEYRLHVNDIDGALTAYKNLQATDLSSDEDIPVVNNLIVALCPSPRHDFDTIMNVAADLSDRRARFAPETVAKLSLLHLNRDEIHDVTDLLNTHAYHYSSVEKARVREPLLAYCLASTTPIARSWDTYTIIREVFDELDREARTNLMTNFFQRDRPDMAVHVFNHMRSHSRADTMPTSDTYVTAFIGTAKRRDLESLEVLHNQLKLDFNITLNTRLRNALIIGYTSCGRPRAALTFWDDIVASREGPTYNSIHVALRACEKAQFGDIKAQEIWTRLRKMNIELDNALWASYVGALAGNGNVELAIRTLERGEKEGELEVDGFVVGSLFMGTPGAEGQREVEGWARREFGGAWEELEGMGVEEMEDETRVLGIDRSVTP